MPQDLVPQCCSLSGPHLNFSAIGNFVQFISNGQSFGHGFGVSSGGGSGSLTAFQTYRIVVEVFIVGLLCLIGFVGNGLTIVILRSDRDKQSTTNWLLQSLAVVDIIYLLACVFIQPLKAIHDVFLVGDVDGGSTSSAVGKVFHRFFTHIEPYVWTLASIAETITVWIVLLVTVDRYIAICLPLRSKMRTMSRARVAVVAVVVLAVLYNIPMIFERQVEYRQQKSGGRFPGSTNAAYEDAHRAAAVPQVVPTDLRHNKWYFVIYKTICYFVFRKIGPLLLLVCLNARLMRALREMRRRHRYLTRRNRQRENVTLTLVVVVSVFIICELPDVCLRVAVTVMELMPQPSQTNEAGGADPFTIDHTALQYGALPATNALLTLNSAVNFFIYCLIGHKFRHIMFRMVHSACNGRPVAIGGQVDGRDGTGGGSGCCQWLAVAGGGSDCRRTDNEDDGGSTNGFVTPPPSMTTRMSIAMTMTNVMSHNAGSTSLMPSFIELFQ